MQPADGPNLLFSERSLWTMVHGIGLGGAALLALSASLFAMFLLRPPPLEGALSEAGARAIAWLNVLIAASIWLTTIVGTYIVFPAYRATPPEGIGPLEAFPRSLLLSSPETAWLHSFAMETKEHLPWIAAMLATSVAFSAWHYRHTLRVDRHIRFMLTALLGIVFVVTAYVALLGILINKAAPLE